MGALSWEWYSGGGIHSRKWRSTQWLETNGFEPSGGLYYTQYTRWPIIRIYALTPRQNLGVCRYTTVFRNLSDAETIQTPVNLLASEHKYATSNRYAYG